MRREVTAILITVCGGARPFRVIPLTADELAAQPGTMARAQVRGTVECETFRAAMSYANGVSHGMALAGGAHIPVVRDLIMAEADADLSRYVAVNLVREGVA